MTADEALTKAEFLKEHPPAIYPPQIGVLDIIEALAAEVRRLRTALEAIEQRAADNLDDRETVYAVHKIATATLAGKF